MDRLRFKTNMYIAEVCYFITVVFVTSVLINKFDSYRVRKIKWDEMFIIVSKFTFLNLYLLKHAVFVQSCVCYQKIGQEAE